ncbi:alpha/beta fold hydrolase [Pigmentiphaga soli]
MTMTEENPPLRTIASAGVSFSYMAGGSGVPLVLLHGVGSGARSWRAQLAGLGSAFSVAAWDAPGYGESTPVEPDQPTAGDYAARLELFAGLLGFERFHLVGHSLGAIMAARFACAYPARVLSLTLVSPSSGHARLAPEERELLRDRRLNDLRDLGPAGMARARGPRLVSEQAPEAVKAQVIETMARVRPEGYTKAVRMLSVSDTAGDVARLAAGLPVQFIIGGQDVVTPPRDTLAVAAQRPDAKVHVLERCGHALYLEEPDRFNGLLADFAAAAEAAK